MQMICEAYHILSEIADLEPSEIGEILKNGIGILDSFLVKLRQIF